MIRGEAESCGKVAVSLFVIEVTTAALGMLVISRHMKSVVTFGIQIPLTGMPFHFQPHWRSQASAVAIAIDVLADTFG